LTQTSANRNFGLAAGEQSSASAKQTSFCWRSIDVHCSAGRRNDDSFGGSTAGGSYPTSLPTVPRSSPADADRSAGTARASAGRQRVPDRPSTLVRDAESVESRVRRRLPHQHLRSAGGRAVERGYDTRGAGAARPRLRRTTATLLPRRVHGRLLPGHRVRLARARLERAAQDRAARDKVDGARRRRRQRAPAPGQPDRRHPRRDGGRAADRARSSDRSPVARLRRRDEHDVRDADRASLPQQRRGTGDVQASGTTGDDVHERRWRGGGAGHPAVAALPRQLDLPQAVRGEAAARRVVRPHPRPHRRRRRQRRRSAPRSCACAARGTARRRRPETEFRPDVEQREAGDREPADRRRVVVQQLRLPAHQRPGAEPGRAGIAPGRDGRRGGARPASVGR